LPKTFELTATLCWICFSAAHAHRSGNTEVRSPCRQPIQQHVISFSFHFLLFLFLS
jgi:hypothetical protein